MKYKSHVFSEASGSVRGLTYSRGRYGAYVRGRTMPTNPATPQQQAVRSFFQQCSSAWKSVLTAEQRTAWQAFADGTPMTNSLGETIYLSGNVMYCRCNVPRLQAGLARIDVAPTDYTMPIMTPPVTSAREATTDISVAFTAADDWAKAVGGALLVYCSGPVDPTVNYFKGPYRYAGKVAGAAVAPTSPVTMQMPKGGVEGQRVFVQFRCCLPDGRLSEPFRGQADVAS